ncbi:MAG: asparagine synthase (glutamine-hydrolyzing) [Alphaproteobacteria bacterium]|nr:asparagine synthase (glutamine-hydrolyzing) [Alphaproteobacteria bacterium]
MCGLFGWLSYRRGLADAELEQGRAATKLLAHRGPDSQGEWFDNHAFMGHRRLSIIDLSTAANQPFRDPTGRYVLTFNGEIYNYVELRVELVKAGWKFQTGSDTEVLLAGLMNWGQDALTRFDGMFTLALHDSLTGEHLLARDPLGQKPLYYVLTSDGAIYASELRSLLSLPGRGWTIDRANFARYLMLGYYAFDQTPLTGVHKLLPGHCLRVNRDGSRIERYWNSIPGANQLDIGESEALSEFERLFARSCEQSMRSDVPYGVFLSGGIDSSLVAAFCRESNPSVRTVSVAMSEADYDESSKASAVNAQLGIQHSQIVTMSDHAIQESLAAVLASLDEPHADPGYVNAHYLARAARQFMTVALAGDGADELFSGYPPFVGLGVAAWMRHLPAPAVSLARSMAHTLPATDGYLGLQFKALAFLQEFPASDAVRFPLWLSAVPKRDLDALCHGPGGAADGLFDYVERFMAPVEDGTLQQKLLYYYQKTFLPEFVCMHTDRAAMQSSLEVRSPFLSLPLVEFANRLPDRFKMKNGNLKILLRRAAAKRGLSADIVGQRKQGFTFPLARWLKTTLRPHVDALLKDDCGDELIDSAIVRRYVNDHMNGRRNNYRLLYHLIVFRAWRRNYPSLRFAA